MTEKKQLNRLKQEKKLKIKSARHTKAKSTFDFIIKNSSGAVKEVVAIAKSIKFPFAKIFENVGFNWLGKPQTKLFRDN